MRPIVNVTVDGQPIAGNFDERLISLTVTQKEGIGADTFNIELNDGNPFLAIPRKGAVVQISIGYGSATSLGDFVVDKVSALCLPYKLKISGKSADLRSGKLKERQERNWDDKTLKDVIEEIAGENNLSASVDDAIGGFKYEWLGQNDESNINFLRRLEERHNGLFHIKNNRLIFAERGSGNSASGAFMGTVNITPATITPGSCNFDMSDRAKHGKVIAYVQDRTKALREEIEETADEGSDSIYRLPDPYATKEEAEQAAKSKAKDLKRDGGGGSVDVIGNAAITAGAPLLFSGVRPGIDGVPYIIDTATHTYSKSAGYKTKVSAKLFDGKSGGAANDNETENTSDADSETETTDSTTTTSANDNSSPVITDNPDRVAANSDVGTPATPEQWFLRNRDGRIDAN